KNADFNTLVPDSTIQKYYRYNNEKRKIVWKYAEEKGLVPKFWTAGDGSIGATMLDKENPSNGYVRLEKGYISQYFVAPGKGKLKVTFRARGEGKVMLWTCSFKDQEKKGAKGYLRLKETTKFQIFPLTDKWQSFTMETVKTGVPTERVAVRLSKAGKGGYLDVDDVYVTPLFE
ncbi:MAG: hypothetical protein J6331_07855, partial [Lentisphaeria bacterium]|nr:hypothetical protein [Lentisphaeria bacterium]